MVPEDHERSIERISVLHVDDDPEFIDRSASLLGHVDGRIDVTAAPTVREGLAILDDPTVAVDAVISAYDMPDADGIEFLRAVRTDDPDLPFVLFTEHGIEDVADEATSAGVTDYLLENGGTDQHERLANRILLAVAKARADEPAVGTDRLLEQLTAAANDVLWMFTHDWSELLYVNAAYEDIWGQSTDALEANPKAFLEGIHPEDRDRVRDAMERLSNGESVDLEYRVNAGEAFERYVWVQGEPIVDVDGSVTRVAGFARDITDRLAHERTIEELHSTARAVMQARSPEEIAEIVVEAIHDILDMPNNGVWFHDDREDVLRPVSWTESDMDIVGEPPSFGPDEGLAWEVFETGETKRYGDVSTVPGRLNPDTTVRSEIILPLGDHGVITIGSTEADVFDEADLSLARTIAAHTESALDRIEREAEVEDERRFIEQTVDTLNDGFYVVGTDGTLQRWNDSVPAVTGYSDEELDGMPAAELFPADEQARVFEAIEETLTNGRATVEADVLTADGERTPYEFAGSRLTDTDGSLLGLVGVGRDVSERKQYEQELERQNRRLEEFASIVSHDLRNPLNVAEGRLELAREDCSSVHLEHVSDAHDRMETLIEDLLTLARTGERTSDVGPIDLAETVEDSWQTVQTAEATLVTEIDRTVQADRGHLKQLLENLYRNAVEHGGVAVTVTVGDLANGFYVADDGPGIPEDERESVFERGYSTGERGIGFGLSIVDQIADAHGWEVAVTESADGGARFEVTGVELVR